MKTEENKRCCLEGNNAANDSVGKANRREEKKVEILISAVGRRKKQLDEKRLLTAGTGAVEKKREKKGLKDGEREMRVWELADGGKKAGVAGKKWGVREAEEGLLSWGSQKTRTNVNALRRKAYLTSEEAGERHGNVRCGEGEQPKVSWIAQS